MDLKSQNWASKKLKSKNTKFKKGSFYTKTQDVGVENVTPTSETKST